MQFTLLHGFFFSLVQTQADNTASLKPSFIKAGMITLSHNRVHRGKPAGVVLVDTVPECCYR